jgi:tRNA threonylcarbamoyladenosine biosynthesis protein TsaE
MDMTQTRSADHDASAGEARRATVRTRTPEETRALGAALATVADRGDRLALIGPLGAGKTQLAKGFAVGLGVAEVVNSPSFTLMAEYEGRLRLFHQDLYRLAGTGEALDGGLLDERQDDGVTLSEWADRLDAALDGDRVTVWIEPESESDRRIEVSGVGSTAARYVEAATAFQPATDRHA